MRKRKKHRFNKFKRTMANWFKAIELRDFFILVGLAGLSLGFGAIRWHIGVIVLGAGLFLLGYYGLPVLGSEANRDKEDDLIDLDPAVRDKFEQLNARLKKAKRA